MKFPSFKEFRQLLGTPDELVRYLTNDLATSMRALQIGLLRLSFADNFRSFSVDIKDLPEGDTVKIPNQLREGRSAITPTQFIVVRRKAGAEYIVEPTEDDKQWDENYLYLKNSHPVTIPATTATFTVIFLR